MATPKSSFLRLYLSFSVESMQPACKRHSHVRNAASSRDLYHMLGLVLYRSRYSAKCGFLRLRVRAMADMDLGLKSCQTRLSS